MLLLRVLLGLLLLVKITKAQEGGHYEDAVQLAARLSGDEMVIELSEHLIYTIEDALRSVAESPCREAQAVVHHYQIHAAILSSTQRLHIIVDNKAPWLYPLKKDNPIADYFYQENIQLQVLEREKEYTIIELYSEKGLNMSFVANELSVLEYIWLVEIPSDHRGGTDIQLASTAEGYHLVYSCAVQAKSQQIHYWEFLVTPTGVVTFLGEYGAALTAELDKKSKRL